MIELCAGVSQMETYGPYYGWEWTRDGIASRTRTLVVDEADMLLGGGFEQSTLKILGMLRTEDKEDR